MRYVITTSVIGLILGLVLKYVVGGDPVGLTMLVMLVGLPLIGFFATIDDDLPGGFSNPDGTARGPWREWENWADLGARGAVTGIGFAIDSGWNTLAAVVPWAVGVTGVVASVLIHQRISKKVAHGA